MSSDNKSEKFLKELADLDQRLEKIKAFLQESKTGNINDSFLTKDNVLASIELLEKINPEEKNMIYALKMLLPMAEKSKEEIQKETVKPTVGSSAQENQSDIYTQWTPKLKSKIPNHKII